MAAAAHVVLRERQPAAGGDAQLQLDQVEAGDRLGDRVLDLQPRIDFEEMSARSPVDDELDGAEAAVADRRGQPAPRRRRIARAARPAGRRPAPPRSASGAGAAACIRARTGGSTLPWPSPAICTSMWRDARQVALDDQLAVAERLARPRASRCRCAARARRARAITAHALAAAAGDRLQQHRQRRSRATSAAIASASSQAGVGCRRSSARRRARPRAWPRLVAEALDRLRRRADEDEPAASTARAKAGVLGEEAEARMDRVGADPRCAPRRSRRCADSSRRPAHRRSRPTRRSSRTCSASRVGARMHGGDREPEPARRCARCGRRFRRGWRSGSFLNIGRSAPSSHPEHAEAVSRVAACAPARSSSSAITSRVSSGSSTPSTQRLRREIVGVWQSRRRSCAPAP